MRTKTTPIMENGEETFGSSSRLCLQKGKEKDHLARREESWVGRGPSNHVMERYEDMSYVWRYESS